MVSGGDGGRFMDPGHWLAAYSDPIYIVCPRCGGRAVVASRPDLPPVRYYARLLFQPRRLTCPHCGLVREWEAQRRGAALIGVTMGGCTDPFFDRPLWLQVPCRGHLLWAYNDRHLDVLQGFVSAGLRERSGYSSTMAMIPRLPAWIKQAGHRAEVLKAIGALRDQLRLTAPRDRSHAACERAGERRPRTYRGLYFGSPS